MSVGSKAKNAGSGLLSAASWAVIQSHNVPRNRRIEEINDEIKKLKEERARLLKELL